MQNISATNFRSLQAEANKSLRICLGVPGGTSNVGTIAEAGALPLTTMRMQETLRIHLRHKSRHKRHYLINLNRERPSSGFGKAVDELQKNIPPSAKYYETPSCPPWTLHVPEVFMNVPGLIQKAAQSQVIQLQLTLSHIHYAYFDRVHIYTDGSTRTSTSASAIVIPTLNTTRSFKLSHNVPSTTAELHGIKMALQFIHSQTVSQKWAILTDSRAALQSLKHSLTSSSNPHLCFELLFSYAELKRSGHDVVFQWIPGHTGIAGNQAADAAASNGHLLQTTDTVPFTKTDARSLIMSLGREEFRKLWKSPDYHYKPLFRIDPSLKGISPKHLPRKLETLYHRIRLNVAYTNLQRFRYGHAASPNCQQCGIPEDLNHIFTSCSKFDDARWTLQATLQQLYGEAYSFKNMLETWKPQDKQRGPLDAFTNFLEETGLIDQL